MESLFLNNTSNDDNTLTIKTSVFSRWLLQQDCSFKNAHQAITMFLQLEYDFILGFNYIRLNNYLAMQDSFRQLTVRT